MSTTATAMLYGTDASTYAGPDGDDVAPMLGLQSGVRVVAEAVARRLETRRGGLLGHPDEGLDVAGMLGARLTQAQVRSLAREIEREVLRDERVLSATVVAELSASTQVLAVTVSGQTGLGPFALVLRLDGDDAIASILEA